MNFLRLFIFHFILFAKNRYFILVTVTSTLSILLIQYILVYNTTGLADETIWLRTGIFGMWGTTIVAAGILTYQKFLGTLKYLINGKYSPYKSIIALILSCSSFGILAFFISYLVSAIVGIKVSMITVELIVAILLFYTGAIVYSIVIGSLFVLTRNAITYEQIINIPFLIFSGLLSIPFISDKVLYSMQFINPISGPIRYLLNYTDKYILSAVISQIIWLVIGYVAFNYVMYKVKVSGRIEVV